MPRTAIAHLVRLLRRRLFFTLLYRRGRPPWDTGISPPELVAVVEGAHATPPGRALDLGCGTGTNCLYLAHHGWHAVGVDFVRAAVAQAEAKARRADRLPGSVRFLRGDVTRLEALDLGEPFTLLLDLGCLHGIPAADRPRYAAGVARAAAPGALYLLYAFGPRMMGRRPIGLTADEVRALFARAFAVERIESGSDRSGTPSAWYWLRRHVEAHARA
ncbi:MAG: class I SAM-dependent methyltransferase [Ktedonobacterales bacterium]|nr:class I SAM-dependent methyltransferase [Ktedonobacterales bacterium]